MVSQSTQWLVHLFSITASRHLLFLLAEYLCVATEQQQDVPIHTYIHLKVVLLLLQKLVSCVLFDNVILSMSSVRPAQADKVTSFPPFLSLHLSLSSTSGFASITHFPQSTPRRSTTTYCRTLQLKQSTSSWYG